jgi:hypothetical protein
MASRVRPARVPALPGRSDEPGLRSVGYDATAPGFPLPSLRIEPPARPDRRRRRDDAPRRQSSAELRVAVDGLLLLAAVLLLLAAVAVAVGLVFFAG